jgi:hypothetical protein
MKIKYNNCTYNFELFRDPVTGYMGFISPLTGEIIDIEPPYLIEKYTVILTRHLQEMLG